MKTWTKYLAVLAIVGMIATAKAADDAAKDQKNQAKQAEKQAKQADKQAAKAKKPTLQGQVVKVDGNTLTLKSGKKGVEKETTVTADANTVVMIEGKTAKLADLQPGTRVQIMAETAGGPASRIVVAPAKAKKPKAENAEKGAAEKPVEKK